MTNAVKEPRRWTTSEFRREIWGRGVKSGEVIMVRGQRARQALRDTILFVLRDGQPRTGAEIRALTLPRDHLKSSDVYHVNLNAWALVDLQRDKLVKVTTRTVTGPRGGERLEKLYTIASAAEAN